MWVYNGETSANRAILFGNYIVSPATSSAFFNIELTSSSNQIRYDWKANPDWTAGATTVIPTNTWTHICCSYDGAKEYVYINGELQATRTGVLPAMGLNSGVIYYLGRDSRTGATSFLGRMNDFRIYDNCLSDLEVKKIAQGLILHYPLNIWPQKNLLTGNINTVAAWTQSGSTLTLESDGSLKIVFSGSGENRIYNNVTNVWMTTTTFTVSFDAKSSTADTYIACSRSIADYTQNILLTDQWQHYSGQITNTAANTTGGTLSIQAKNVSNALKSAIVYIKNIKLENGTNDTGFIMPGVDFNTSTDVYDISGFLNNITASQALNNFINKTDKRYSLSYTFNNNNYLKKSDFYYTSNIWTASIWYYAHGLPTGYNCIMCLASNDGGDSYKKICFAPHTDGRIWMKAENVSINSGASLRLDTWTHICITCDGTNYKTYENGVQIVSGTISSTITTAHNLGIGCRNSNDTFSTKTLQWAGELSDFRIYATALSAAEVKELYDMGRLS